MLRIGKSIGRFFALAALAVSVSGCALPPIVTAISFGADVFSMSETGKSVSDHGISFVMQQDCALLRVFEGGVCRDYLPSEDTPEGALVALAPLTDPKVNSGEADPMTLPPAMAYLDGSLGLAVAAAPEAVAAGSATAFAELKARPVTAVALAAGAARGNVSIQDLTYLTAGIGG